MIALKYPKLVHEEEGEEWIWEEGAWYWEEEEEEDLPICFGDYGRYTVCMFCEFAVACSEVRAREEAPMADALDPLIDRSCFRSETSLKQIDSGSISPPIAAETEVR